MVAQLCEHMKTHRMVPLKYGYFTVCELYLNLKILKQCLLAIFLLQVVICRLLSCPNGHIDLCNQ